MEKRQGGMMVPFFIIWTGQAVSLVGSQITQFALIWWLTKLTGSATVLAMASLAGLLPRVLLGPLAGAYVDRWNRRLIMGVSDSVAALAALWLAYRFWLGTVHVWDIYLLMIVRSLASTFQWPAMQASTTLMVPEKHLARVAGVNQSLDGILNIAGPPLGALAVASLAMAPIMLIDVLTAFFAVVPLFFIRIPQPARTASAGPAVPASIWADLRTGLLYIWRWPGMVILMGLAMAINFILTPAFSLTPILIVDHFGKGALELSWLEAAWGVGVILGGVILAIWGGFRRKIYTSLLGVTLMGGGLLGVGLTPAPLLWLAIAFFFIAGFMLPLANGPIFALLQATVEPEMQGRVFTVILSLSSGIAPLGLVLAGPAADTLGVRAWFLASGVVCVLLGLAGYFVPPVINLEDNRPEREPLSAAPAL